MRGSPLGSSILVACFELAACGSPTGFQASEQCLSVATEPFEVGLRLAQADDTGERWTLAERMEQYRVPGVSVATVRNGELAFARGYGTRQSGTDDCVDTETVFSVGSISKVGAATLTLGLVDDGVLDLEADVDRYLTRWEVPDNSLTQ